MTDSKIWSPLKYPSYRSFWICAVLSSLGTWIQDVASSWVMTHLSISPLVISLLAFSNSLPLMLFSIPAGLLSDFRDRRKILLFSQILMFVAALFLGILVWKDSVSEISLLFFSMVLGVGNALASPSYQTVLSDLVPTEEQQNSVMFYYLGINVTRVLGPALGGIALSFLGPGVAFWVNAISFFGMIIFLWIWPLDQKFVHHKTHRIDEIEESDYKIIFSIHNIKLWFEIFFVTFFASCLWALYPSKGRVELHLDSLRYGSLLGLFGLGACLSAIFSKRLMGGTTTRSLARSYLFYSLGLLFLGLAERYEVMIFGMFFGGVGWIILATLMNMSSRQMTSSSKLKATMLGVFLTVFYLGFSVGSLMWGGLALWEGLNFSFFTAALGLALVGLYKLSSYDFLGFIWRVTHRS